MTKQPASQTKARVMLVEDHPVVLRGLANLIDDEPDLMVVGGAESIEQAIERIPELRPDILVIDISLGQQSGLDLIKRVSEEQPELPLLALSMHDEALYAERALRAGAKGYIMKKEAMEKVMGAIRRVLQGDIYISEKMASRMVHKLIDRRGGAKGPPSLEQLSDREFEVFNLIAQGIGPTEIANRLSLSVKTVESHREHIKQKLGLSTAPELTRFALQWTMDRQ
jgi:DNA-binding NarL/FixJ family response regulator